MRQVAARYAPFGAHELGSSDAYMARVIRACRIARSRETGDRRAPLTVLADWAVALRGERSVDGTEQVSCADAAHVVHDVAKAEPRRRIGEADRAAHAGVPE